MHQSKTLQVAIATFIGAFIGSILSVSLQYNIWIGMLVGGAIGYISFEFSAVIAACKKIARETDFAEQVQKIKLCIICTTTLMKAALLTCLYACIIYVICATMGAIWNHDVLGNIATMWDHQNPFYDMLIAFPPALIVVCVLFFGICACDHIDQIQEVQERCKKLYAVVCPSAMRKYLTFLFSKIPSAFFFILKMMKRILVEIHTEERLHCMTYAALGALISKSLLSEIPAVIRIIVGASIGTLFSVLTFWMASHYVGKFKVKSN